MEGFRGTVIYSTDLFEAETIERLVGHFLDVAGGDRGGAGPRIGELPLLTEASGSNYWSLERHRPSIQRRCLHELFEEQVAQTPDAVAVVFEDQQLTYRELNARADQLAHHLQHLGVGPEVLIGLCLERSSEMIVGLLGILKAGGAYLPLDPGYPSRTSSTFMVDRCQPSKIVPQPNKPGEGIFACRCSTSGLRRRVEGEQDT